MWSPICTTRPWLSHSSVVNESGPIRLSLRALAIALGAFVMLGVIDGALGVAWPSMRAAFSRDLSDLGLLLAFGSIGYLAASTSYGRLHSRVGTGLLLSLGSGLLALGVTGIAFAPVWAVVAVSAIMLGLGGGLVDTGMNAHAALAFDVGSINLLHACYGVGATLGPVVITISLVSGGEWRGGYSMLAALQVVSAVTIWKRRRRWEGFEPDLSGDVPKRAGRLRLWSHLLLFFLYTGVEVATGQWAFTLLSEGRGMTTGSAGVWVAVYWGGLTIGRFGFGVVGERLSPSGILNGSMAVSLFGLGLLWLDPWGLGVIGLPIAGLGLAAVFPTLVAVTPGRIGRLESTRSMGYQLASANLGAATVPWVLGILAETSGLEVLGPGLFATAMVLASIQVVGDRR